MSFHSEIFSSSANINRFLKELGSTERLNETQMALLKEYQSLGGSAEDLFNRACAQEAVNFLNNTVYKQEKVELTEYGVTFEVMLSNRYGEHIRSSHREKELMNSLAKANCAFLEKWLEIRIKKHASAEEIAKNIDQIREVIDSQTQLILPGLVIKNIEAEGFKLVNPSVKQTRPSEILTKGLKIEAIKAPGYKLEIVFMPSGRIYTHLETPKNEKCDEMTKQITQKIGTLIENLSKTCGAPKMVELAEEGIGKGKLSSENQSNNIQQIYQMPQSQKLKL